MNEDNARGRHLVRDWVEDSLREAILADQLGVSEMPVREAVKKLAAEGAVEYLPYRGMRVREYSADDVADIGKVRACTGAMAACAAAQNTCGMIWIRTYPEEREQCQMRVGRE